MHRLIEAIEKGYKMPNVKPRQGCFIRLFDGVYDCCGLGAAYLGLFGTDRYLTQPPEDFVEVLHDALPEFSHHFLRGFISGFDARYGMPSNASDDYKEGVAAGSAMREKYGLPGSTRA